MNASLPADQMAASASSKIVPGKLAHFVVRAKRFQEMLAWYRTVFHARTSFENPGIAFLTYDEEHHRMAFLNTAHLPSPDQMTTGVDHVAFTYDSLSDLLLTYERLKQHEILPFWCINHGPTTSMYYHDPDGNDLELQVDNYDTVEEACGFFSSDAFAANPLGVDFNPDELLRKLRAGVPVNELLRQGSAPVEPGKAFVFTKMPPPPGAA
jgi:catechol 2,3-dioxygenase-like lactoylglutathione lyase family enzyme